MLKTVYAIVFTTEINGKGGIIEGYFTDKIEATYFCSRENEKLEKAIDGFYGFYSFLDLNDCAIRRV